ncbi:MAG: hypothetical protein ACRDQA_24725 [Nocardioidaceae bacterium]
MLATVGLTPDDPQAYRYTWLPIPNGDPRLPPLEQRLLRAIADRHRWRQRRRQVDALSGIKGPGQISATEEAAA